MGKRIISPEKRTILIAGALATLVHGMSIAAEAGESSSQPKASVDDSADKVACYGAAKAGTNDCADLKCIHGCQGMGLIDYDLNEWKLLPKGTCAQLGGKQEKAPIHCHTGYEVDNVVSPSDIEAGRQLYYQGNVKKEVPACVACHGEKGESVISDYPKLSGQHAAYITRQLYNYKSSARIDPVMNKVAAGLDSQDIGHLAKFLQSSFTADVQPKSDSAYPSKKPVTEELNRQIADVKNTSAVKSEAKPTIKDCKDCPELVPIKGGSFVMGSPLSEIGRYSNEVQHQVTVSHDLAVGKYPITFEEWDECVADGGCGGYKPGDEGWGRGNRPVVNVSWDDTRLYIQWLNRKTGKQYRLLSEAEWEYVAKAGTTTPYWWGDRASHDFANYGEEKCCSGKVEGRDQWVNTSPVGSFPPNPFGIYDVLGNVWEWNEDCWHPDYNAAPLDAETWTGGNCKRHSMRGGSWFNFSNFLRAANRYSLETGTRSFNISFRVVRKMENE